MRAMITDTQCIVFDFDGTLATLKIDFKLMRAQVAACFDRYGIPQALGKGKYVLEMIAAGREFLSAKKATKTEIFLREATSTIRAIELKAAHEAHLITGVTEMLAYFRGRGIKMAIVTRNCRQAVEVTFPSVHEYVDLLQSRDDVCHVKPDPQHLSSILTTFTIPPDRAIMVGDHPMDIIMGRQVGTNTVGVRTGSSDDEDFRMAQADYILDQVTDLIALLDSQTSNLLVYNRKEA